MKNGWKLALVGAALASSAGIAKADLALSRPTGLFLNPTATVAAKGVPEIAVGFERLSKPAGHENLYGVVGAVGVADGLEISASYSHLNGVISNTNAWSLGTKYQITKPTPTGVSLSVGAGYRKVTDGGPHSANVYAVATKNLNYSAGRAPIKGTLGVRYNDYSNGGDRADIFAGLFVPITRDGEFNLVGELGTSRRDNNPSQYALGVRYSPKGRTYNIGAGVARNNVFVHAGYKFGK